MQHNLRDPNRDQEHGRVYRVTYEGRPLIKPAQIAGEPIDKLLDLLKHPEDRVRYRARIELSGRDSQRSDRRGRSLARVARSRADPDYEHHVLEALWVHQHHNVVNTPLLGARARLARLPRPRRRRARALLLARPRPQLARPAASSWRPTNIRACGWKRCAPPASSTCPKRSRSSSSPPSSRRDTYLDFVRDETMKTLDPIWKKAVAEGRQIAFTTDAGARFLLRRTSATSSCSRSDRTRAVYLEMLYRPGLRDEQRREAVRGLAQLDKQARAARRHGRDPARSTPKTTTSTPASSSIWCGS